MKKMFVKYGILVLAASSLAACQNAKPVNQSIKDAVTDNQKSQSVMEWETSENHPEIVFEQWNDKVKDGSASLEDTNKEFCTQLAKLDKESLTVFESEIAKPANAELLSGCKEELTSKVEDYYQEQRKTMEVSVETPKTWSSGGQFPDNVQKRDLSNGYRAVTGDVGRKELIITFDDGPSGRYTDSILKSLEDMNAKAIFFMLGKNAAANPSIVKKVAAKGHAIGSHSMTHACLGTSSACRRSNGRILTFDQAVSEIRGAHTIINNILGWVDPFFRFPYGEASPELKNFLKRNQVGEFFWSIDSEDWKAQSNSQMLNKTLSQLDARGRGLVLFHDIQRKTAEVMPQFLREVYKRGYSVVLLQSSDSSARYNSSLVGRSKP